MKTYIENSYIILFNSIFKGIKLTIDVREKSKKQIDVEM